MAGQGSGPYIAGMDLKSLFDALSQAIMAIPQSGLLIGAVAVMVTGWIGGTMARHGVVGGRLLSGLSTLALIGILVTVVLQLSRFDPRMEIAVPQMGLPEQVVEGGETRIELARDGHFWLRAQVDGVEADFLVDTGATLTAVSSTLAEEAGLEARRGGIPLRINTANGPIAADLTSIEEMRFGNVAARGLDAVIAPNIGETNVIGMNLLSRLASWRVEGDTMILVPNNPQAEVELGDR